MDKNTQSFAIILLGGVVFERHLGRKKLTYKS